MASTVVNEPPAAAVGRAVASNSPLGERGSNARGIAAMLAGMFCFVASDTMIKLVGRDLAVGQVMFLRGIFATLLLGAIVLAAGTHRQIAAAIKLPLVRWRTAAEAGATLCFFSGLVRLPFADAAAIGQFTPLAVTAAAALFLGEPVGWRRWLATIVGLIGVMIIIRPGTSAFDWAALFVVGCVCFVVVRDLTTRQIGGMVPASVLVFLSVVAVTFAGLAMTPFEVWPPPTRWHLAALALSAVGVSGGYYGTIIAMRSGEISVVAPFRYAVMLYALFWGYFIFDEVPDRGVWAGTAIVIAAGLYTVNRERVRNREAAAGLPLPDTKP